jgi:hypothetical protein
MELDVAKMLLQLLMLLAVPTQLTHGILLLKLVSLLAHVKVAAITIAVMSWTTSCTRPLSRCTTVLELASINHSILSMPIGILHSAHGGQLE